MKWSPRWIPSILIGFGLVVAVYFRDGLMPGENRPAAKPPSLFARELIAKHYGYAMDPRAPDGIPAELLHLGWASLWDVNGRVEALLTVHRPLGSPAAQGDDIHVDVFAFPVGAVKRIFHRAVPALGCRWEIDFVPWPEPHLLIAVQRGRGAWLDLELLEWSPEEQEWRNVFSVIDVPDASVSRHAHGVRYKSGSVTYDITRHQGVYEAIPSVLRPLPFTTHDRAIHVLETETGEWNGRNIGFEARVGPDGITERVSEILSVGTGDVIEVWSDPRWPDPEGDRPPELRENRPARFLLNGGCASFLSTAPLRIRAHRPGLFSIECRPASTRDAERGVYRFECVSRYRPDSTAFHAPIPDALTGDPFASTPALHSGMTHRPTGDDSSLRGDP